MSLTRSSKFSVSLRIASPYIMYSIGIFFLCMRRFHSRSLINPGTNSRAFLFYRPYSMGISRNIFGSSPNRVGHFWGFSLPSFVRRGRGGMIRVKPQERLATFPTVENPPTSSPASLSGNDSPQFTHSLGRRPIYLMAW